jgi:hypothetical protein
MRLNRQDAKSAKNTTATAEPMPAARFRRIDEKFSASLRLSIGFESLALLACLAVQCLLLKEKDLNGLRAHRLNSSVCI